MGKTPLRYVLPLMLLVVVVAGAVFIGASESRSSESASIEALPEWASSIAKAVATSNSDIAPTSVQFALTNPAAAAAVAEDKSEDGLTQVYAVLLRGDFTMKTARLPFGTKIPKADWILLVLDPKTQGVLSMSYSSGSPDTSSIGAMSEATF